MNNDQDQVVQKQVWISYNEHELLDLGKQAAEASSDLLELQSEFDEVKIYWKGKIEKKDNEISGFLRSIKNGGRYVQIPCTMKKNFKKNLVQFYRKDTKELVEERAMIAEEMQMEIDDVPALEVDEEGVSSNA